MRERGSGRRAPESPVDRTLAVADRQARAAEELLDVRLRLEGPPVEIEVRNPVHGTRYRVFLPAYPELEPGLCTCTDFARRGLGTCKHIEATRAWLGEHPVPEPRPERSASSGADEQLWKRIDRRLERLRENAPRNIREVEAVGRLLIDGDEPSGEGTEEGVGEEVGRRAAGKRRPTPTSRARP